jgi:hypothetical protein
MDLNLSGGGRSFGLSSPLGDSLPGGVGSIRLRAAGALGAILGGVFFAQWAAGALTGAGVTWGSAQEWRYGPGVGSSYTPDFTLGSTMFYARAGAVLHVSCDVDVRVGGFHLWLWRLAGLENSSGQIIKKSGVAEFAFPIRESGFYKLMHVPYRLSPAGSIWEYNAGEKVADLGYKLSWRLER